MYSINLATAHRHCEVENRQGTEQQKKVRFASGGNRRRSTQQTALHSDTEHDSCQHCLSLHLDQLSDDEERVDSFLIPHSLTQGMRWDFRSKGINQNSNLACREVQSLEIHGCQRFGRSPH